jgi:phosphosulfolactate phosphohydrolase-like enzyme
LFEATVGGVENKNVVVIDILRATTTMCVAMENGANSIWPVDSVQKAAQAGSSFLTAGERNGEKVEGFDLGNSPQEFSEEVVKGRDIVMTTTNGTKAISLSEGAKNIYIASYRNISAVVQELQKQPEDIVLFCSGWKDQVNLEDTLFAGEVIYQVSGFGGRVSGSGYQVSGVGGREPEVDSPKSVVGFRETGGEGRESEVDSPKSVVGGRESETRSPEPDIRNPEPVTRHPAPDTRLNDRSWLALKFYEEVRGQEGTFLENASHVQRFKSLHIESDLEVCLKRDTSELVLRVEQGIIRRFVVT